MSDVRKSFIQQFSGNHLFIDDVRKMLALNKTAVREMNHNKLQPERERERERERDYDKVNNMLSNCLRRTDGCTGQTRENGQAENRRLTRYIMFASLFQLSSYITQRTECMSMPVQYAS